MMKQACTVCGVEVRTNKDGSLRAHVPPGDEITFCPGGRKPKPKTVEAKADLYIEAGKYRVIDPDVVLVFGSQPQPYVVRRLGNVWACECEARTPKCAHSVVALRVAPAHESPVEIQPMSDLDSLFEEGL